MSFWWLVLLPAALSQVINSRDIPDEPDDWKEMGKGVASFYFAQYPVARDVANYVITGWDYSFSPTTEAFGAAGDVLRDLFVKLPQGELDAYKATKHAVKASGPLLGFPSAQAITTMDGLLDLWEGDTEWPHIHRLALPERKEKKR